MTKSPGTLTYVYFYTCSLAVQDQGRNATGMKINNCAYVYRLTTSATYYVRHVFHGRTTKRTKYITKWNVVTSCVSYESRHLVIIHASVRKCSMLMCFDIILTPMNVPRLAEKPLSSSLFMSKTWHKANIVEPPTLNFANTRVTE